MTNLNSDKYHGKRLAITSGEYVGVEGVYITSHNGDLWVIDDQGDWYNASQKQVSIIGDERELLISSIASFLQTQRPYPYSSEGQKNDPDEINKLRRLIWRMIRVGWEGDAEAIRPISAYITDGSRESVLWPLVIPHHAGSDDPMGRRGRVELLSTKIAALMKMLDDEIQHHYYQRRVGETDPLFVTGDRVIYTRKDKTNLIGQVGTVLRLHGRSMGARRVENPEGEPDHIYRVEFEKADLLVDAYGAWLRGTGEGEE